MEEENLEETVNFDWEPLYVISEMHYQNVLLGSAIALSLVFGFAGCSSEDDDDDNNMISGSSKNYSIAYNNTSSDVSRGYKTTTFKHLGALCQIRMSTASAESGAMGYIWDLESNSSRAEKNPRRFFLFGFNYTNDKVKYYLSLYKNVTDIQLNNMGATAQNEKETGSTATSNGAKETEYWKFGSKFIDSPETETVDGTEYVVVTVNVYEGTDESGNYDGTYHVDLYNGAIDKDSLASTSAVDTYTIPGDNIGYLEAGTSKSDRQKNGAVYANVYAGKTLTGTWKYIETYSEAEEVVE